MNGPEPRAREQYPAGYAYYARFPALRPYAEAEGGTVYVADTADGHYVITDESTLADLLGSGDAAIVIHAFDTAADRDAYCARRFAALRTDAAITGAQSPPVSVAREDSGGVWQLAAPRDSVRLSYKSRVVPDFSTLVRSYGDAEFRSPVRSTVPLLAWWRSWDVALAVLEDQLGQLMSGPVSLAFEHPVRVRGGGRGPASQTDLLVSTPTHAVAIEAKSTEPPYPTVAEWLTQGGKHPNRIRVLSGWLELLNQAAGADLTAGAVADSTYQLIHRTASACAAPASWRAVVYQGFGIRAPDFAKYVEQTRRLYDRMGRPSNLCFHVLDHPLRPTPAYADLRARWASGARDLAAEVRAGLLDGTLITRGSSPVTPA